MKEWEKHLERARVKLKSANLLFEKDMLADAISEVGKDEPSKNLN